MLYGLDEGDLAKFGSFGAFIIPEVLATTFAAGVTGPTGAVITSAGTSAILETARLAFLNKGLINTLFILSPLYS